MFRTELSTFNLNEKSFIGPVTQYIASTASKSNISDLNGNQNGRDKYRFTWRNKEIELVLEKFYFSDFLILFHVVHTLRNVFQKLLALLFLYIYLCNYGSTQTYSKIKPYNHQTSKSKYSEQKVY